MSIVIYQWFKVDLVVAEDATKRLYKGSRASYLSGIVLAILFASSILITSTPEKSVYIWLALTISTYILRYVISIYYKDKHQEFSSSFWLKKYRIGVAITGVMWASSMFILFQPEDQLSQSIILFTLAGICAAAALSYAIDYVVLSGFVLPITLAIFFRLAFEG